MDNGQSGRPTIGRDMMNDHHTTVLENISRMRMCMLSLEKHCVLVEHSSPTEDRNHPAKTKITAMSAYLMQMGRKARLFPSVNLRA